MLFALLSIACTCVILILFREFKRFDLPLLPVITTNYLVCFIVGAAVSSHLGHDLAQAHWNWLPLGTFQGMLFISLFFLIGTAAQTIGIAYTAIFTRIQLVIPTLVSVWVFHEQLSQWGWVGIGLAIGAIIMLKADAFTTPAALEVEHGSAEHRAGQWKKILMSSALFFGTGLTDTNFKIFDHYYADSIPGTLFTIVLFGIAFLIGVVLCTIGIMRKRFKLSPKVLIAGVILGVPNYFSIYFLLKALSAIGGAKFYPVNNVGILILTSTIGALYYKEPFSWRTWLGFAIAIGAIILLTAFGTP
jgi:drug/metabolite transporter (DMT)-like permease